MQITKDTLYPTLLYSLPFPYSEQISIVPVRMEHILEFQFLSRSLTVRKESIFPDKNIIRMSYLEFLIYAAEHEELSVRYGSRELKNFYGYVYALLSLVCPGQSVSADPESGWFILNGELVTPDAFEEIRRIILLQNGVEFDPDEFLHFDTEQVLRKAQAHQDRGQSSGDIEDYIDSLCIFLHCTAGQVREMPIRKFWRYLKRCTMKESYTILKTGECSGMVSFREPVRHWMVSLDEEDKYQSLKTNEQELRNKIG